MVKKHKIRNVRFCPHLHVRNCIRLKLYAKTVCQKLHAENAMCLYLSITTEIQLRPKTEIFFLRSKGWKRVKVEMHSIGAVRFVCT